MALAVPLRGQGHYESGFEGLQGSAAGTAVTGQDGFFLPPARLDARIHTYAGNALGVFQNQSGGSRFLACQGTAAGAAAAQRLVTMPVDCEIHIEFDVCVRYLGAGAPPTTEIGGFSLQPAGVARTVELAARWPAGAGPAPASWDADVRIGPGAGTVVPVQHVAFQGLLVDVWHRWGATVDLRSGAYTGFNITNGLTGVRTLVTPPPGSAPLALAGGPLPDSFRVEAAGAGAVLAFDRFSFAWHAHYRFFGAGCAGSLGTPVLTLPGIPVPAMNTTFRLGLGNLPLNLGIVTMGFSAASSGPFALPLDLGPFGLPGCMLLADPAATALVVGTGGLAQWSLFLPENPSFMGAVFYNQGFALDPGINAAGITASRGGRGCVGR
jgi:hypothetical protein